MSAGETAKDISGWTTDTLKEHVDGQLCDLRRMLDERMVAQQTAMHAALAATEKAVTTALEAVEKSNVKAELATDKRFECVAADTPILCADLIWRPAGDLLVGDELIAVDEVGLTRRGRRYRRAVVTANNVERDALLAVHTPMGTIRCNRNHPWLSKRTERSNWKWVQACDLQPGDYVHHAIDTWEVDRSWEGGWLAGMYDGEGCLSLSKGRCQLTMSQRESPTSDLIFAELKQRLGKEPLSYRLEPGGPSTPNNTQPFFHFMVADRAGVMKILGSVRPPRLLVRAEGVWEGSVIGGWGRAAIVTSVESAGSGLIAQLSTSTHTYIAGGFVMHNSVNEFRQQLNDQANTFMPRTESISRHDRTSEQLLSVMAKIEDEAKRGSEARAAMEARFTAQLAVISSRLDLTQGRAKGLGDGWGYLVGAIGLLGAVIAIVLALQ